MSAQPSNQSAINTEIPPFAQSQIVLRVPRTLKGRAVRCSRIRNLKLSPWLTEAIEEKCEREEAATG